MNDLPWFQIISGVLGMFGAWTLLLLGIIKWFLKNYHQSNDEKFVGLSQQIAANHTSSVQRGDHIKAAIRKNEDELHRIEKDIMQLRAELPERYQRREDAIRETVLFTTKIDALGLKIDNLAMRGGLNAAS